MSAALLPVGALAKREGRTSQNVLAANAANELIFAVVGHVGSGTSEVAKFLKVELEIEGLRGGPYTVKILKASDVIRAWAIRNGKSVSEKTSESRLTQAIELQNLGDEMRLQGDHAVVAKELVRQIRATRGAMSSQSADNDAVVLPDGKRRAYILDSVRHPAEVFLLRNLYQSAFALLGVVCDEEKRAWRLTRKFEDAGERGARKFMARDNGAKEKHGQRVEKAFHLADYFIDNSVPRQNDDGSARTDWKVPEQLSRLIKIVSHSEIIRPFSSETAMYVASGAERRSACLSRQVGATLLDREGNVIATGTNEVPRAGGGVHGQGFEGEAGHEDASDDRCFQKNKYCSNTVEQKRIVDDLLDLLAEVPEMKALVETHREPLIKKLRDSRIGELLEFSRAVHAEMDALLSAARKGVSAVGTRMFVTTFPCHYCARHIVTAGVDEVQYIEAYPKSRALSLHSDSIAVELATWTPPSASEAGGAKVLFRPFTGVAPRLYARAFIKDRELKDSNTGDLKVGEPEWGGPWDLGKLSYIQLEHELFRTE